LLDIILSNYILIRVEGLYPPMPQDQSGRDAEPVETDPPSFKTISQSLGKPRRELLMAFLESDRSTLNTAQLREQTTVSRGSTIHHLERLVEWGLVVEEDARERHGRGGRDARTWALTDRGETFCADHLGAPLSEFVSPDDIAELNDRLTGTTERTRNLEEDMAVLLDAVADIGAGTGQISDETETGLRKKSQRLKNQLD
jgi:DNA-binding PadR family transcriptional regulator